MAIRQFPTSRFEAHWLAHAVRLQDLETNQHGKVKPVFPALSPERHDAETWLIQRAYEQHKDSETLKRIQQWQQSARFVLAVMMVFALVSGASAAIGFFGSEQRNVNVIWTLIGLIGVHCFALLAWLVGGRFTGGWMGRASFWVMSHWPKLATSNRNKTSILTRALAKLMSGNDLGKWALSCITHSAWLIALLASLLTMLVLLSVRSYSFVLETTILSAGVVEQFVHGFAFLPSLLGFAVPSNEMITAALSSSEPTQSEAARRAWASCVSGGLVVYAIIPRSLVLTYSLLRLRYAYSNAHLDLTLPGFAELFAPSTTNKQVVDIAPEQLRELRLKGPAKHSNQSLALVAIELGEDFPWPPNGISDLKNLLLFDEVVESGAQQKAVLQVLKAAPVGRVLIVCDARVSPDRGSLQWFVSVSEFTEALAFCVTSPVQDSPNVRREVWAKSLAGIGLSPESLFYTQADGLTWLTANE